MKEYLIQKYESYIKNLEQLVEQQENLPARVALELQLNAYREILTDLKML